MVEWTCIEWCGGIDMCVVDVVEWMWCGEVMWCGGVVWWVLWCGGVVWCSVVVE